MLWCLALVSGQQLESGRNLAARGSPIGTLSLHLLALAGWCGLAGPFAAPFRAAAFLALPSAGLLLGRRTAAPASLLQLQDEPEGLEGPWRVAATVLDEPEDGAHGSSLALAIRQVRVHGRWLRWSGRVLVSLAEPARPGWERSTRLETFLRLRSDRAPANPGSRPLDRLRRAGFDASAHLKSYAQLRLRRPALGPARWVAALRSRIRAALAHLVPRHDALARALLLGERRQVPDAVNLAFSESGLGHVLAISGMHVGLWIGLALLAARALGSPPSVRYGAGLVAGTALVLLVRQRASVLRAATMGAALFGARLAGPRCEPLDALVAAAFTLTWLRPRTVSDLGFQLSVTATAALLGSRPLRPGGSPASVRWLITSVRASVAAQVATAPLVVGLGYALPLATPLLNLLAVPLLGLSLPLLGATVLADILHVPAWAQGLGALADALLGGMTALARAGAAQRWALLPVPSPSLLSTIGWLTGAAAIVVGLRLLRAAIPVDGLRADSGAVYCNTARLRAPSMVVAGAICMTAAAIAAMSGPAPESAALELWALDVGQGDALLVRSGQETLLLDAGGYPGLDYDVGAHVVVPVLRHLGVRRLDIAALSHAHADHAGGLPGVVGRIATDELWIGSAPAASPRLARLLRAAATRRVPALSPWSERPFGACRARLFQPPQQLLVAGSVEVRNDASLVIALVCGSRTLLLTGDAGAGAERIWPLRDLDGGVLKVGHHGSRSATSSLLLQRMHPRHAILSVGARNPFGLPHDEVLQRLRAAGAAVYRTDRDGALRVVLGRRVRVSGSRWSAGRGRTGPSSPW